MINANDLMNMMDLFDFNDQISANQMFATMRVIFH